MAARTLPEVREAVEQLLKNEYTAGAGDFPVVELDLHILEVLKEISERNPFRAIEPIIVAANSRLLDISGITGLIRAMRVEYPISDLPTNPRIFHELEYIDNETVEMVVGSTPSAVGTAGTVTGVVTFTASSVTVTGTGALVDFDGELEAGSFIKKSTRTKWYRVLSIESNSSLTLEETVKSGDAGADTENATMYRTGVAIVHCDKIHTVTASASTLNSQLERVLIEGVVAKAALAWLNKVRDDIVPSSVKLWQGWADRQMALYRNDLDVITPRKSWRFYGR